jgi:hypothetical protein
MFKGMIVFRHKHGVSAAQPYMLAHCADCGRGLWNEWYAVKKSVWERAWPGTGMKSVHEPLAMKHFLCIACLEKRIGRRLTRSDFDMRRPLNNPEHNPHMSRRFRHRLRNE